MKTVREATFQMLRERGMTTIFGNPGSTELPMLTEFPEDFRYVLALQEASAVGIADGYAQAVGHPALVNLHTAPGLGNAMGAIFNAQANKSPLVITAGQQYRSLMTLQANLANRDATRMPHPLVKWSYEPPCAQDVPHALARATHLASLPPRGPVFVSIPMDDWYAEVRSEDELRHQTTRTVTGAAQPDRGMIEDLARRLAEASNPAFVAGPDIDAAGGWDAAVRFAERARLPVYATPPPAVDGSASRRTIRCFSRSCRRLCSRSAKCSRHTTSCWRWARRSSPTTPTSPVPCWRMGRACWRSRAIPTRRLAHRWGTRSWPMWRLPWRRSRTP